VGSDAPRLGSREAGADPSAGTGSEPPGRSGPLPRGRSRAQSLQLLDDQVETLSLDELHRVIQDVAVLADLEDGHDIGVMEPGRGAGLVAEPLQGLGVAARAGREDLQGHLSAQRDLLGLVDHPHAAAADLAEDAEVADLAQGRRRPGRFVSALVLADLLGLLEPDHRREQVADLFGQLRVAIDVFLERRPFATPEAFREFLRQLIEQVILSRFRDRHRSRSFRSAWHRDQDRLERLDCLNITQCFGTASRSPLMASI
jgi:hypothetical protein